VTGHAEFVTQAGRAADILDAVNQTLRAERALPAQVFKPPYTSFAFFDYATLQRAARWLELLNYSSSATLVWVTPSAENVFGFSGDARYGIIDIRSGINERELTTILATSPTANSADAFTFACMRCVVLVENRACAIFGDRYWDLAVVAFRSQASRERFRDCTDSWRFMTVGEAAERVQNQSKPNDRSEFIAALRANYASATPLP
jgi:hypothetical protein